MLCFPQQQRVKTSEFSSDYRSICVVWSAASIGLKLRLIPNTYVSPIGRLFCEGKLHQSLNGAFSPKENCISLRMEHVSLTQHERNILWNSNIFLRNTFVILSKIALIIFVLKLHSFGLFQCLQHDNLRLSRVVKRSFKNILL